MLPSTRKSPFDRITPIEPVPAIAINRHPPTISETQSRIKIFSFPSSLT
jgi:hypothetical protein